MNISPSLNITTAYTEPCSVIVDADSDHTRLLETLLLEAGLAPIVCRSLAEARETLTGRAQSVAAAFIALDLPDGAGLELLGHPGLFGAQTDIALMHDVDDPVRAALGIQLQASYFFCKPLDMVFVSDLLTEIKQEWVVDTAENKVLRTCALDQFGLLRGSSPSMRNLYRVIRKIARTKATVLLVGESGTGKELAAQTLHQMSGLSGPFVAVNCGAISADLAESELFGHEKGSFSGADRRHAGYFERAEGGTLMLDEIGEMSLTLQVKLLRVLETRTYRRVGGTKDIAMDVRFITATNRDPAVAVRQKRLREDLYFRIAHLSLEMPPLRERCGDVVGLAQYFLTEFNAVNGTRKYFSEDFLQSIAEYSWPGNVRELKNTIERAYIMADQQLKCDYFPDAHIDLDDSGAYLRVSVSSSLEQNVKQHILASLNAVGGDKKEAADNLGISLKTLYNRMKKYDELIPSKIDVPRLGQP